MKYRTAVRANRQLTTVLRGQGLNEEANHFAYRAQLLQRVVWRLKGRPSFESVCFSFQLLQ